MHLVWIPKYPKKVLVGPLAIRVRDLIRQIAIEHELQIASGKVSRDHARHLTDSSSSSSGNWSASSSTEKTSVQAAYWV